MDRRAMQYKWIRRIGAKQQWGAFLVQYPYNFGERLVAPAPK
jgi:hypothetical protein